MTNSLDKYFFDLICGSQSLWLDHFALVVTNAWTWLPLYIMLFILIVKNHDNMQQIVMCFVCAVLGVLLATGLTSIVAKPYFERLRPCNDPEFKYLVDIANNIRNKDYSFFSSHAATSMSLVAFMFFYTRSGMMTFFMFVWSLSMAWSRMYLAQHFFTDVAAGMLWGMITGSFAYFIYKTFSAKLYDAKCSISDKYTSTGIDKHDIETVTLVILLTFLYAAVAI